MTTFAPFGSAQLTEDPQAPAPEPGLGELAGQGLRAGALSMRGNLHKVAGTVMDATGFSGSDQRAASAVDRANAQVEGRDLVPFNEVHDVRSGLRYIAGAAGGMVPAAGVAIGAGLLTGGGALPALAAGALASAPNAIGDQLQRQDEGSANNFATPGQRLATAVPVGLGRAALENIVPAGVAMRLAGRAGAQSLGQIGLRAAADIPANAMASGGSEALAQFGDNRMNPNAGYDRHKVIESGIEGGVTGGVFGVAGAAGHAMHSSGAAIKGAPGRAFDAVKGLVPESAQKRAGEALDVSGDVLTQVTEWSKGKIGERVGDVKAWGKEFMADEAAPDSFKAQVQEAVNNPGDKAKQAWLATQKFTRDAAGKVEAAVTEADVPTKLRELHRTMKDSTGSLMDKMADGVEVADHNAPDFAKAAGEADKTTFQKAKQWAEELATENLGPEETAKLKAAVQNLSDKVSQQTVATLKRGQLLAAHVADSARGFNEAVNKKVAENTKGGVKKSEDYSGARKAIGEAVMGVLGADHPAMRDPKAMQHLADGLRPYIEQVASGRALDSFDKLDHLTKLFDVTGDQTTAVLKAVHTAVSGSTKDEAALFRTLNQIDAIRKGKQGVVETLAKNLRPELQDSVRPSELKAEAAMLEKWAQSKVKDPSSAEKAAFNDAQVRDALQHRYGDKTDLVMKAVETNMKAEVNALDLANTSERTTEDGVSSVKYFAQNKQLYLHPDLDKGGTTKDGAKYDGAATQRMKTAQKQNPDATVQFRRASEIGLDDPMVKAKHADLVDEGLAAGLDATQAKARADKEIDKYGAVTAEQAKQETAINSGDLKAVSLDAKKFSNSPSRIDAGDGVILDAVKLGELMHKKLGDHYTTNDDTGTRARAANMFKEGVAAVQDHLGRTFDIPDETRITKAGLTWGEAKKLDVSTATDKASDASTKEINDLRQRYREAKSDAARKEIAAEGKKLVGEKEWAVIREQAAEAQTTADGSDDMADPFGNVHAALKGGDNPAGVIRSNSGGEARGDTVMGRRKPATSIDEGAPPSPKARAAKQAAFVEKARSGDEATLKAVKESTDAKGLQRAVEHLNTLKDAHGPKVADMVATINARMAELVSEPGNAYGLQTKRYSLQSTQVHESLGRRGFAATHDSPIKHEGAFDWRTHALKGEGAMVKGAGTYLSTGEQAHTYYKKMFSQGEASPTYHLSVDIPPERLMDWDKPLSEQSATVRLRALKAIKEHDLTGANPLHDGSDAAEPSHIPLDMNVRGEDLYRELSLKLGGDRAATEYLQGLGIYGHTMKAGGKSEHPNFVIYDDSKITTNYVHFSQERTDPNAAGPADRAAVMAYLEKTHGDSVSVAWANILHAGEFERTATGDIVRLSLHALNPMSVAYHESLHGFMAKLRDAKHSDIAAVLEAAGESAPVMNQLKRLLASEPEALKQLTDPEERAAYMYQFWAQGKLTVGPKAETMFQRIAQFIRKVTGFITNDERAEAIMAHFHSGEFEASRSDPNAVHRAMMESSTGSAVAKLKAMTEPFREMGEAIASAGGARLRDTGVPALRELADAMKLKTTTEGADQGYLPAARAERSRLMNQIGSDLKPYSKEVIAEALEAMQTGTKAQSVAARTVALMVNKRLGEALTYMQEAGVKVEALGMQDGVKYFPRSWDASYVSSNQGAFLKMVDKYVQSGAYKGDPKQLMHKLMVTDGAEFHINVEGLNKPGMQNAKERVLSFIDHADAAPFMQKNMYSILNNYVTQATRRAEWSRRFQDDGSGVGALLDKARSQGATPAQIEAARGFVQAVDGTLGDNINPTARRVMGNMIVYQNIRLLPLAIFSSAVDAQGIIVRGGTVGDSFKTFTRGMREVVKNFKRDATDDKMTQLAETLGVVDSAMLVHTLGASYSQGMVGNKGRAINDTFFRFNLMEQYNTSMRVGATEAAMNFLVRHSTRPSEHSTRFLGELGLKAADVVLDGDGRPKLLERDGLTLEHAAKMKAAVNRWVDGAILRPDAVDKPVWMSDPHFALVAHLKQFVFSFHETILKRVAHEAKHGNFSPAMALASYVPMMIAADALKGLIQGGGQQPSWKDNWGPGDYAWSGMERAGLFGTGQFGIDMLSDAQRGGSGVGALMGPSVEQMVDAVKVMGGREHFGAFALKSMPANALYAAALHGEATDPKFAD